MAQSGRTWLSRHAQQLVVRTAELAGEPFDCDLLIVGSGYGGAVAAARAAGHNVIENGGKRRARVWVLERGNEYLPGMFPSRFSEIAGHVRFDAQDGRPPRGVAAGLFDARVGTDVCVLLGSGLGGGSLINAGVMMIPDEAVFAEGWPRDITRAALEDGYKWASDMLKPQKVPDDKKCAKLRSFVEMARPNRVDEAPLTVHWQAERNAAGVQMQACTLCGDCLTGCNQSAKGSVDTNYLAFARAHGAEMFCGGTVSTLARDPGDSFWQVRWHYTEPALRPADGMPFVVRAKRVVLAAGALGSTEILLRSESASLRFSDRLGEKLSINGSRIAAGARHPERVRAVAEEESDPADEAARRIGPTITGLVQVPPAKNEDGTQGPGFVVEEFAVPAGLRHVYGEIVALLATLNVDRIGGADPFAVTDDDIDRIGLYGLTGDDGAQGCVRLPIGTSGEGVRIDWPKVQELPLFERMQKWLGRRLMSRGALLVPNLLPVIGRRLPATTVHPLGGCRMADGPNSGVVDHRGCVFVAGLARDDLVVLDGAIVPRALGINPALTIAALAERAMPLLLGQWGWKRDAGDGIVTITDRPTGRRRELPASDTVWSIRERVHGLFSVDSKAFFWARMDVEFEEIPGFRRALALQSRAVAVRRAVLTLYAACADDDEFTVDEPVGAPACTAELAGSVALFVPLPDAAPDDERVTLHYRLSVQSVQGDAATPLAVGGRLEGLKVFGRGPHADANEPINIWRQLTEMGIRYDGVSAGHWTLDVGDLAQRRDPLLRMVRVSSMPDALDDLAAIALYVLRRAASELLLAIFGHQSQPAKADHLNRRWPSAVGALEPQIVRLCAGARLARYRPPDSAGTAADLPPVVLIHGLGSSGASFTDDSMPSGLAATLLAAGREVWVLDLRSSIGNEYARHGLEYEDARRWTVEGIARADIPQAIDVVSKAAGGRPVDVFAHCMGAMMFCLAALGGDEMKGKVRAVVLSQDGPLVRYSPMNRLRGYVASYLQQFLRIETLDTCPAFVSRIEDNGCVHWDPPRDPGIVQLLVDGLLSMFPYPDDDNEAERTNSSNVLKNSDFRRIRHRGDAIFGQLFELANVSDDVLARLEAFMGWVMVPMLAQAIHYARRNMLTNARGQNAVLHEANFTDRFGFPVLIIHGRRNRVFDWRGSRDTWIMLKKLRGETIDKPARLHNGKGDHYGANTATQLAVFDAYGHLDCIVGQDAHRDIFGVVSDFFRTADGNRRIDSQRPKLQFEAPWIGPMLGWIRPVSDKRRRSWWRVRLLVHPQLRRAKTEDVVIVPVRNVAGIAVPQVDAARVVAWPRGADRHAVLDLHFNAARVSEEFDTFALLTMHQDLPLKIKKIGMRTRKPRWLKEGRWLDGSEHDALCKWIAAAANATALADGTFSLAPKVVDAADRGEPAAEADVCFALASCQYPPGLFDERPASASYERLLSHAMAPDGPQFLVLCGDQVYVDATAGLFDPVAAAPRGGDVQDSELDRTYELNWRLKPFRRATARLPVVAMLDDHEVTDNWKGLKQETDPPPDPVRRALDAYDRYQGLLNPVRPLAPGAASDRSFYLHPGGVRLFVLDTRCARSPRDASSIGSATIVPDEVMQGLQQALAAAPSSAVKLVVSPSPILPAERFDPAHPAERLRFDSWTGYPASMIALLGFIRERTIRRVVFLSGDAHLSSVCTLTLAPSDGKTEAVSVVSVISSGMYTPWPFANKRPDELALAGQVDLGLPGSLCAGTMRLHAISTSNGYAIVRVVQNDSTARLIVSLRSANGATTDCEIELT
jgi:choline dehydrogenase-like flavoprotein